jgi:hypothetical protein
VGAIVQNGQKSGGPNAKRSHKAKYADSREGRRSQIQGKLNHGIRNVSPVLLAIEKEREWVEHYQGVCESLAPGNQYEANLVYLIAWQFWRLGRLVRHETELTLQKIYQPPQPSTFDHGSLDREAIQGAVAELHGPAVSTNGNGLSRYDAIAQCDPGVMFSPQETRGILESVLERIRDRANEGAEDEEALEPTQDEDFTIEERPWSAKGIAAQIGILSEAAGTDWREELSWVVHSFTSAALEQAESNAAARRHVIAHTILGEKQIARLSAYERQIMASLRSFYTLLERARAYRLGMPVPPPVSVDVNITKTDDANSV